MSRARPDQSNANSRTNRDAILTMPQERKIGWHSPAWDWPPDFKQLIAWLFAATAVANFAVAIRLAPYAVSRINESPLQSLVMAPVFSLILGFVSACAWWAIWRGRQAAREWAIIASLICITAFMRRFVLPVQPGESNHVGALAVGVAGLATFLWPGKVAAGGAGKCDRDIRIVPPGRRL